MPEKFAVDFLREAKADRALAIDDFRDAFGVSYETAAHRFTNLATHHFGIPVHFTRVHESGMVYKAYENDGVRFPVRRHRRDRGAADVPAVGVPHGVPGRRPVLVVLPVHRHRRPARTGARCTSSRPGPGEFSVTVGTPYEHARWFRGGDTTRRTVSRCPDPRLLPAAARRPGGALGRARLAERPGALPPAGRAAAGHVPRRRRPGRLRVPAAARAAAPSAAPAARTCGMRLSRVQSARLMSRLFTRLRMSGQPTEARTAPEEVEQGRRGS